MQFISIKQILNKNKILLEHVVILPTQLFLQIEDVDADTSVICAQFVKSCLCSTTLNVSQFSSETMDIYVKNKIKLLQIKKNYLKENINSIAYISIKC